MKTTHPHPRPAPPRAHTMRPRHTLVFSALSALTLSQPFICAGCEQRDDPDPISTAGMVAGEARILPLTLDGKRQGIVVSITDGFTPSARAFRVTTPTYVRVALRFNVRPEIFSAISDSNPSLMFEFGSAKKDEISFAYRYDARLRQHNRWTEQIDCQMWVLQKGWMLIPANDNVHVYLEITVDETEKHRLARFPDRVSMDVVLIPWTSDGVPSPLFDQSDWVN
jgi:hypothetical protein